MILLVRVWALAASGPARYGVCTAQSAHAKNQRLGCLCFSFAIETSSDLHRLPHQPGLALTPKSHMIEVLLSAVPSLCWLLFRCYQLLKTPASRLVRQLNVEIPHAPLLSIDDVGSTHILLHWETDTRPDENLFFVVLVNGNDAGTLTHTSVRLTNMKPGTLYSIQVLAINVVSTFRSQSQVLYVCTSESDERRLRPAPEFEEYIAGRPRPTPASLSTTKAGQSQEQELMRALVVLQQELAKLTGDLDLLKRHQPQEEESLKHDLEKYKQVLNEGVDLRHKRDSNLKDLEKTKDTLSFRKLKLSKQLKQLQNLQHMQTTKIQNLKTRLDKLQEKKTFLESLVHHEVEKLNSKRSVLEEETQLIKSQIIAIEKSIKALTAEKKVALKLCTNLNSWAQQMDSAASSSKSDDIAASKSVELFAANGLLTEQGLKIFHSIFQAKPDWVREIQRELDHLQDLESSWQEAFRDAVREFVKTYNISEATRAARDPHYEPAQTTSYKASIEFGGIEHAFYDLNENLAQAVLDRSFSPLPAEQAWGSNGLSPAYTPIAMDSSHYAENKTPAQPEHYTQTRAYHEGSHANSSYDLQDNDVADWRAQRDFFVANNANSANHYMNTLQNMPLQALYPGELEPSLYPVTSDMSGQAAGQTMSPSIAQPLLYEAENPNFESEMLRVPLHTSGYGVPSRGYNGEPMYVNTPPNDKTFLAAPMKNLQLSMWHTPSQSSLLDTRSVRGMLPQINPEYQNQMAPATREQDSGLLDSFILPSISRYSGSNSIWLNRPMGTLYSHNGHNRAVSSGSHIWGTEGLRPEQLPPPAVLAPDFQPFTPLMSQVHQRNRSGFYDDHDIRLLPATSSVTGPALEEVYSWQQQ